MWLQVFLPFVWRLNQWLLYQTDQMSCLPIHTRGMFSRASACEHSPKFVLQIQGNLTRACKHPLCWTILSYIYLLALSSSVLSIHCVEAVISGSWTRQIRCLDRAQHLSLLMGLRLYGIALEPIIKVQKVLIIKVLKVLKNTKLIYYLILTCSFKDDFLVSKSNESEAYFQWTNLIQFIFWIISKLVHVGIHHSN